MGACGGFEIPVKSGLHISALTALLSLTLTAAAQQQTPQQPVPDAPTPQQPTQPLTNAAGGPIKPGGGAGTEGSASGTSGSQDIQGAVPQQPAPPPPSSVLQQQDQGPPPQLNMTPAEIGAQLRINVTYVEVPVTVKDSKGAEVPGLQWRDFKVYENNTYVPLKLFYTDSYPLSIAFVVDQSLPRDQMEQVNTSLGALQGALTPYDEIAVFTYGNGARNQSGGFTGAQSARVPYILSMTKSAGAEQLNPVNDGPFASCNIRENGNCVDPNLQAGKSAGSGYFMNIPKEIHTLNDAVFAAAKELSSRPQGRRRVIYVISDGKEYGSKATYKEVLHYLQTNHILVYGTLVGEAARWGEGRLSRIHLPFTMYDNILVKYTLNTGGTLDSANGVNHIEKTYTDLAREARTRYTLIYASHEPLLDGKYRKIDVRINRPNLDVTAPLGYYPAASDAASH
jgi:VWFA-related protein